MGKHHRPIPKNGRHRACRVGQIIHSGVVDPIQTASQGGSKYFLTFTDDYSGYTTVEFMKAKSELFTNFKNYSARIKKETGLEINVPFRQRW